MTRTKENVLKAISFVGTVSAVAVIGVPAYHMAKKGQKKRVIDKKLDGALEDSMDCSDATAKY